MPVGPTSVDIAKVQDLVQSDPKLSMQLEEILTAIQELQNEVFPPAIQSRAGAISTDVPDNVGPVTVTLQTNGVRLDWMTVDGAAQYEIREGASFETGDLIDRTTQTTIVLSPFTLGTHTLWITAINVDGNASETATEFFITIPNLGVISINSRVIDNNILLSWNPPSSTFTIAYYNLYKDSVLVGTVFGTFTTFFESIGGTFEYGIEAIDIASNASAVNSVELEIKTPPDYVLTDSQISDLNGTKTNVVRELDGVTPKLLCCVDTTETWADHFSTRTWANIQDQIDAGYAIYAEPAATTGSYVEVFDYGAMFGSIIVNLNWSVDVISGNVSVNPQIEMSDDGITYGAPVSGSSAFGENVRFVRITINFTGTDDKSLIYFFNLQIYLDVKREMDSGNGTANAADTDGTVVNFNKIFKDVDSITLDAQSLEPIYPIYDFDDIPNPTSFSVFLFDSSGNRITSPFSWKARGIV